MAFPHAQHFLAVYTPLHPQGTFVPLYYGTGPVSYRPTAVEVLFGRMPSALCSARLSDDPPLGKFFKLTCCGPAGEPEPLSCLQHCSGAWAPKEWKLNLYNMCACKGNQTAGQMTPLSGGLLPTWFSQLLHTSVLSPQGNPNRLRPQCPRVDPSPSPSAGGSPPPVCTTSRLAGANRGGALQWPYQRVAAGGFLYFEVLL